jgi:SAM-dependent methyltransferase
MANARLLSCPACDTPIGLPSASSLPWAGPDVRGRSYFRCPACDLVFLDPGKRPDAAAERERYRLHRNSLDDAGYRGMLESFIDGALSPFLRPPAAILDYGSGPEPAMAVLLDERGYSASSWDPIFMPNRDNRSGPFDGVILHEVLEHCFNPALTLRDAAAILSPGGILAVSTLFRPPRGEDFLTWWYREDVTHVSFYSIYCLSSICESAGFEPLWSDGRSNAVFRQSAGGPVLP